MALCLLLSLHCLFRTKVALLTTRVWAHVIGWRFPYRMWTCPIVPRMSAGGGDSGDATGRQGPPYSFAGLEQTE